MQYLLTVGLVVLCGPCLVAGALQVAPTPPPRQPSPLVVSEFRASHDMPEFFQLHNTAAEPVRVSDWQIVVERAQSAGRHVYTLPAVHLLPGKHLVMSALPELLGSPGVFSLGTVEAFAPGDTVSLVSTKGGYDAMDIPINAPAFPQGVRYGLSRTAAGGITAQRTYKKLSESGVILADAPYVPPATFSLAPIEILPHARACAPHEADTACGDYVKFHNTTNQPIDFSQVRLRVGYKGQVVTKQNTIELYGVVQPGEYATFSLRADGVPISLPNAGAFVWLEDVYGIVVYSATTVEYPDASAHRGESWAQYAGGWQWSSPQPHGKNEPLPPPPPPPPPAPELPKPCPAGQERNPETGRCRKMTSALNEYDTPCPAGQERNPETGRCRKVVASATAEKPCPAGQERNPETGRCRKIVAANVAAGSNTTLKPCGPGEYRNPATGRCRKLTAATTSTKAAAPCPAGQERNPATGRCRKIQAPKDVKPCPEGQERNPETGRCRKIPAKETRDTQKFPAEETTANQDTIAGWLALAGVGSVALGYAGWEWRREIASAFGRIKHRIAGGK